MRILITGADRPLGLLAARELQAGHALRLTGEAASPPAGLEALPYVRADLREPEQVAPLVEGIDAIAHLALHAPRPARAALLEQDLLDASARGTYLLLREGLKAGVRRLVLASHLDLMAAYGPQCVVDETWKPMPDADAASLALYAAELTLREFVRAEEITGICLRFGDLGSGPADTTPADAAAAIAQALTMDLAGRHYRWWLYHVGSTDRYPLGAAAAAPLSFTRGGP